MASKVIIDGQDYELTNLADVTMGQARILKRYTGLSLEELTKADPTDPDVMAGICHLVLAAAHPDLAYAQVEAMVDNVHIAAIEFTEDEEDDADPPTRTQNEPHSENGSSGDTSGNSSDDLLAPIPLPTGRQH